MDEVVVPQVGVPELLWKSADYDDHSCVHSEWKRVAAKYNADVGFDVCRIVSLHAYHAAARVGVGVECLLCGPNTHRSDSSRRTFGLAHETAKIAEFAMHTATAIASPSAA